MQKKWIVGIIGLTLIGGVSVQAEECRYATNQEIVRRAENMNEIRGLGDQFDVNEEFPCGGSLIQLAVLRGNVDTFPYLVRHGVDLNMAVSTKEFDMPDTPDMIPFPLFAARFAPNSALIDYMLNNGADFKVKDAYGHDALWYFEQNPVLRSSYLTKKGVENLIPASERIRLIREGNTE